MTVAPLDAQLDAWRAYMAQSPALSTHDVEELETHLVAQIHDLEGVGLSDEEAFLVAVKRMGDIDAVSREFALEHSDRLWKQLVMSGTEELPGPAHPLGDAIAFAAMAAISIHLPDSAPGRRNPTLCSWGMRPCSCSPSWRGTSAAVTA